MQYNGNTEPLWSGYYIQGGIVYCWASMIRELFKGDYNNYYSWASLIRVLYYSRGTISYIEPLWLGYYLRRTKYRASIIRVVYTIIINVVIYTERIHYNNTMLYSVTYCHTLCYPAIQHYIYLEYIVILLHVYILPYTVLHYVIQCYILLYCIYYILHYTRLRCCWYNYA